VTQQLYWGHEKSLFPLDALFPFFQPIVSVSDGSIVGYEVLARIKEDNGYRSLGSFFGDKSISFAKRLQVDRLVREKALRQWSQSNRKEKLFINIFPSWLLKVGDNPLFTLVLLEKYKIPGNQVVIEIIEEELEENCQEIKDLVRHYRKAGCQIAVDDFYFNNFDRLIHIRPDFVKIDIRLVRLSVAQEEYRKIIHYISQFSQEMGVSVLFEGVETDAELRNAIESGSGYVQGFIFSEAKPDFQASDAFRSTMQSSLFKVIDHLMNVNRNAVHIENEMNSTLENFFRERGTNLQSDLDELLTTLCTDLPAFFFKAYICDKDGTQRSSNVIKNQDGHCIVLPEYNGRNWGWRPYFFYNVVRMENLKRGVLSNRYLDEDTKRETLTFSYPLSEDLFLFLDFYYNEAETG